jgi:hypothetical protein
MHPMNRSLLRPGAALACTVALSLAACSPSEDTGASLTGGDNPDATVFLAQNTPPDAVMEALYVGKVNRDEQGCLRVESEGGAVVIWPYHFTLEARDGGLFVKDAQGRSVGRIGGEFRMGGGFVPSGSFAQISEAHRALAQTRCPSTHYWIVGDTD